jgi:hypothetical protein
MSRLPQEFPEQTATKRRVSSKNGSDLWVKRERWNEHNELPNNIKRFDNKIISMKSWKRRHSNDNNQIWKSNKQANCGYGEFEYVPEHKEQNITVYKVLCQYFPPGNLNAGAGNIRIVEDKVVQRNRERPGSGGLAVVFMIANLLLH